jgi:hypothetical protein
MGYNIKKQYEARFVIETHKWGQDDFCQTTRVTVAMARFTARGPRHANIQCFEISETIPGYPVSECFEVFADGTRAKYTTREEFQTLRQNRRAFR